MAQAGTHATNSAESSRAAPLQFVPRPGGTEEDDGWLLTVMFDSGSGACHLAILDAQHLEAGPVALLCFRRPVPSGLHGCWTSSYYGPQAVAA